MATQRYTASKSPTKDRTAWVISFRHPLRKDPRGKQGLKIRRGLGTSDETKAQALVDEMNVLLGDLSWHSITKRAEAERRFSPIIVRAFYDNIETPPSSSWDIRNEALRLPAPDEGYSCVLLVGTTGAGKTSLLRHLIGSHPKRDRFPSTSASRATISDIEVIRSDATGYRGIVTFFNEWAVQTYVHECVAAACSALWEDLTDDRLADRLLTHRDLRFRLGYIIGSWRQSSRAEIRDEEEEWAYDNGDDADEDAAGFDEDDGRLPSSAQLAQMHETLRAFLDRIRRLSDEAKQQLRADLKVDLDKLTGPEREAAQDLFEEVVQSLPDFDDLVNDIMDEISERFEALDPSGLRTRPSGWPESWQFESSDRDEFVRVIRRFCSNDAPAFGTLLTPLVDGIRIKGRFPLAFTDKKTKMVLLDGEGLGHVSDPAAGVATRIARRFGEVDVILLVDSAKAPMLDAPTSVLRAVAASGYQSKLAFAFTHFDLVRGEANLPTLDTQRTHVLSSIYQRLGSLRDIVDVPAVRAIERDLEERCFMLGFLNRRLTEKNRGPVKELLRLIDFCEAAIEPEVPPEARPVYDTAGLVLAIQAATVDFQERWDIVLGFKRSGNIRTAHWAEVKAMNRRVVLDIDHGEYKDLRPVVHLVARLSESLTKFLGNPLKWEPAVPADPEAEAAIARVQRAVFGRLHEFVEARLLRVPRQQWMQAFDFRGPGSTFERRAVIKAIYEASAPIPGPAMDVRSAEFLREVRRLVHHAVKESGGDLVSDALGE